MDESAYILGFSNSIGVGPKRFLKLLKQFSSAEKAWKESSAEEYKEAGVGGKNFERFESFKKSFDISDYLLRLKKAKVEFIPYGNKYYPESLTKLDSPPIGLYVKGNKDLLLKCVIASEAKQSQVIAVVGARKITSYGRQVTESLVSELYLHDFIIVSGMALGVDGVAHQKTIDHHGSTIAVLGCGVDCPYPRENGKLYEEILDSEGLVISEYSLGMPANPGTFPARNRIISGLSSSVLVTEAAEDSGSLITADCAIKQGKTVFAVPGPITSQMSRGSLKLLKQGAILVSSGEDILNELRITNHESRIMSKTSGLKLSKDEQMVLDCLQKEDMTIDEISSETGIKLSKLSGILSEMELAGTIKNSSGKFSYAA